MKSSPPGLKQPDEKPKPFSREKRLETPTLELGQETESQEMHDTGKADNRDAKECKTEEKPEVATKHDHKQDASSKQAADTASPVKTPAGVSDLPEVVHNEPCISPTEQLKALGRTPKPKGRPSKKKPAAKAKSKAEAKSKAKAKAKSKAKAKAKAKARSSSKRKAEGGNEDEEANDQHTEEVEHEEQEDEGTVEDDEHEQTKSTAKSSKSPGKVTRRARSTKEGSKAKAEGVKGSKAKEACKASSSKAKQSTKKEKVTEVPVTKAETAEEPTFGWCGTKRASRIANEARAKAKALKQSQNATENNTCKEITPEQKAKKQLLSRKSSASHKARKAARDAGASEEEAKAAAAKAT
eukprot:symbB.v1.2.009081.t1/scaffold567.1/size186458/3